MENPETIWLVGAAALVAGVLIGVLAYRRFFAPRIREADQARAELTAAREELENFKASVNQHFDKTSELVNDLTQNYARVYQHLAEGAQTLGDGRRFSNALEQQPGRVSIALADASVVPEKPVEPAAEAADADAPVRGESESAEEEIAEPAAAAPATDTDAETRDPEPGKAGAKTEAENPSSDDTETKDAVEDSIAVKKSVPEDQPEKSGDSDSSVEAQEPVVNIDALEEALEKGGAKQPTVTGEDAKDDSGDRQRSTTH